MPPRDQNASSDRMASVLAAGSPPKRTDEASGFTCPECHGSLWTVREGHSFSFECRTEHRWSVESMAAQQAHNAEAALYAAMNQLQERAGLLRLIAERERSRGEQRSAQEFERQAGALDQFAQQVRDLTYQVVPLLAPLSPTSTEQS